MNKKDIMKVFTDGIRKQVGNLVSSKNNGHHSVHSLPDHCVPTGMQKYLGGGNVVIKDLTSCKYTQEFVEKDLDIIQEQIEFAIDELEYYKQDHNAMMYLAGVVEKLGLTPDKSLHLFIAEQLENGVSNE